MSPAAILAAQLREALAANTIGGRADDEARWRNAADEVRKAQASWRRLGPVPDAVGRELEGRFQQGLHTASSGSSTCTGGRRPPPRR